MKYSTNSLSNTCSFFTILRVKVVCKSSLPTQKEKTLFEWRGPKNTKWRKITLTFVLSSCSLLGAEALTFVDSNTIPHTPHPIAHTHILSHKPPKMI